MALTPLQMIAIPVISGLIGWLTNYVAVRMLFRPRRELNILGLRLQGLVPRRQAEIAASIGRTVQSHLISHEDLRNILGRADVRANMETVLSERLGEFIDNKLRTLHPMAGALLSGSLRQRLESMLLREVERMLPEIGERMIDSVEDQLNFQQMVEDKVKAFDLDQLERMILGIAHRELRAIELLGGVLGFVIGIVQVAILLL